MIRRRSKKIQEPMQNILIIFQAATQETESLALAFGLGAVQAGGNIRLRHLDPSPSIELAHAGYGILRTDDLRWAEGVAILLESPRFAGHGELRSALEGMAADPPTGRRWAYLFHADPDAESRRLVRAMLRDGGFQEVEDDLSSSASLEHMTRMGQQFAKVAISKT
jgi:hypothetical protein